VDFKRIENYIGRFNKIERIYLLIFILSIASGIVYGIIDSNYYKCCEDTLSLQPGQNEFSIFLQNFELAVIALITAGFSSFYFLFTTFAISSSSFFSSGQLIGVIFLLLLGSLELIGVFLFGVTGFSIFETRILKIKSKIKIKGTLLIATILLFVSAVMEYFLVR
jgi:hypothetical protein